MADNSKGVSPVPAKDAVEEEIVGSENEDGPEETEAATSASGTTKAKKSKRKRIKKAIMGGGGESTASGSRSSDEVSKVLGGINKEQLAEILKLNPALAAQLGASDNVDEAMKNLSLQEIMTGLASSGKNVKDMASYKFWSTQPVAKFGEENVTEGPFKMIDIDKVSKEPGPLVDGFEWVTIDLTNDEEIQEVYSLLYGHYVEDDEAMFRFNYSLSFLKW